MARLPTGRARSVIALGITLVLWASAFAGIRTTLHWYSPGHLALLRYAVASLVLGIVALFRHRPLPPLRDLPGICVMGLLGFTIYNAALNYGETRVTAGAASFLINTSPVFTVLLAILFLKERLNAWGWAGIAVSFAGVTVIALGEGHGLRFSAEAWLIVLAALSASGYTVLQKNYLQRYRPLELTTYVIWAGTAGLMLFWPGLLRDVQDAPPATTAIVFYLGVFPAAFAYVTWTHVLSRIPASIAVSFLYLVPVLATFIAWLWLGEAPSPISLGGGALALLGVALVSARGRQQP